LNEPNIQTTCAEVSPSWQSTPIVQFSRYFAFQNHCSGPKYS